MERPSNSRKKFSDSGSDKDEADHRLHEIYEDLKRRSPDDKISSRLVKAYEDSVIRSQIITRKFTLANYGKQRSDSGKEFPKRTKTSITEKNLQQPFELSRNSSISDELRKSNNT